MAKKKTIQDYLDELQNRGAFTDSSTGNFDDVKAKEHINSRMAAMEAELKKWDDLKWAIKSHYAELDRLSSKKYRLFNVPTWKEELSTAEKNYQHFYKELEEISKDFNAKWGKASKKTIEDNLDEWMKDNNKLVEMQKQSLEMVEKLAAQAMDEFRKGSNVFDRLTPHIQAMFKGMVQGVDETKNGMKKMWDAYSSWVEPWAKANQAAADFSKNVGLGAAGMQNLLSETIRFSNQAQIGIKYNKSLEEMIKLQQEYTNAVGRNIGLTDNYKESLAAMSAVMGDQKTADIAGKLENFGINPEETGRRMGKMFSDASKKGIAFSKYSETFANNIKMAQNYTFANGVKGVASMAEKATKLKLEMQSVAQFAEKVNTVEGAITTGAKLQVLGGAFTQFADPLQMLYEGTSDAEGLQDRIINMFGDLGRFNKLTGEVEVSAFDRQRIRAAGEAIGVNSAELMDMIHAKGKRNEIANQMRGLGYSADLEELIMNTATFDDSGRAGVSINGQFVGVDQLAGREQELIALNQTETEDIKEIATTLRGWDDTMQGFKKQLDAKQASWVEKSGLGSMGMRAVQYLGQANWALNTIVGVLTAGKAINFGMGAYGTAAGVTRTGAAAFQRVRMNNWMKDNKLAGKNLKYSQRVVGKNIGVLYMPDRSGNRSAGVGGTDLRAMKRDWYRSQGADLGISSGGIPLDPNRGYGNYLSMPGMPTSTGTPSVAAGGMMGHPPMYGGMGYNHGTTTFGTPNVAPATGQASAQAQAAATTQAQGNLPSGAVARTSSSLTLQNTNKENTWIDGAGNKIVQDKKGNYRLYTEGKKGYTNLGKTLDGEKYQAAVQANQKAVQKAVQQSTPKYQFGGEAGQRVASNEILKLKDGRTVRMGDFKYSETNPGQLVNEKTGQKITMNPKNGQWQLTQKGQKGFVNLGRTAEGGGLQTNNNTVTSTRTSMRGKFSQWGDSAKAYGKASLRGLGQGAAMAGGMMLGAGLSMGASAIDAKRQEMIANGELIENSNEDWKKRRTSKALSWAGTGASIGAMIGNFIPIPGVGTLIGAAAGALIGGVAGLIAGKSEQKKEQEKARLHDKIARFRNGQRLSGEYDNAQLSRIAKYVETNDASHITSADLDALKKNGRDYSIVVRKKYEFGGIAGNMLVGPSHKEGGIPVKINNSGNPEFVEMQGGEGVIRREAVQRYGVSTINAMNNGTFPNYMYPKTPSLNYINPKITTPNYMDSGNTSISPRVENPNLMAVSPKLNTPQISGIGPSEISLKPLDININGSIKLDAGKGNQVDITKLLQENPKFIRDLTEMIEKQININTNGAYNKEKSLNKF